MGHAKKWLTFPALLYNNRFKGTSLEELIQTYSLRSLGLHLHLDIHPDYLKQEREKLSKDEPWKGSIQTSLDNLLLPETIRLSMKDGYTIDPKIVFDWNQKEGNAMDGLPLEIVGAWTLQEGKYFLDMEKTYSILREKGLTWADFILTCEMVKRMKPFAGFSDGNYGGFRRRGWNGVGEFNAELYGDTPEECEEFSNIHARAVWDYETTRYAMLKGLTNAELLRFRLEARAGIYRTTKRLNESTSASNS